MSKFSQTKVPNGKLLQLEKFNDTYKITGDFFCHPESLITDMEDILSESGSVENKRVALELIFTSEENEIVGFGVEDLWKLYLQMEC